MRNLRRETWNECEKMKLYTCNVRYLRCETWNECHKKLETWNLELMPEDETSEFWWLRSCGTYLNQWLTSNPTIAIVSLYQFILNNIFQWFLVLYSVYSIFFLFLLWLFFFSFFSYKQCIVFFLGSLGKWLIYY